ncbi:MAG: PIN domain-containing protein [Defluviicoccus sp.]|nr:PIN domain-containing protein [Defluviicoccus sp.]MDE0385875.1 PIN domain-containing protein [Defluviicoccus sp.]
MPDLLYWDSACFLAWLRSEEGRVDSCQDVFALCERGEASIVTSTLTIAEVLMMGSELRLPAERRTKVRGLFARSYIRTAMLTRPLAEAAQDVVWDHDVRPKDAVHVATAIDAKADVLNTFDTGLIGKSGKIGAPPLKIAQPFVASPELGLAGRHPQAPA